MSISVTLFFSPDERLKGITEYNSKVDKWNDESHNMFKDAHFSLDLDDFEMADFELNTDKPGHMYPVRDSCKENGDPDGGCKGAEAAYFKYSTKQYPKDEFVFSVFDEKDNSIVNATLVFPPKGKVYYDKACYRLSKINDKYVLDPYEDSNWLLRSNSHNGTGCYFGSNWEPLHAVNKLIPATFTVELRYYQDPVVYLSGLTFGCSELSSQGSCFGLPKNTLTYISTLMMIVTGAMTLIELIVLIIVCVKCRNILPLFGDDSK